MARDNPKGKRLIGIFLLACVLFNQPFLGLFNRPVPWFGIPSLYLYLFVAWGVIILLIGLASISRPTLPYRDDADQEHP